MTCWRCGGRDVVRCLRAASPSSFYCQRKHGWMCATPMESMALSSLTPPLSGRPRQPTPRRMTTAAVQAGPQSMPKQQLGLRTHQSRSSLPMSTSTCLTASWLLCSGGCVRAGARRPSVSVHMSRPSVLTRTMDDTHAGGIRQDVPVQRSVVGNAQDAGLGDCVRSLCLRPTASVRAERHDPGKRLFNGWLQTHA